MIRVAAASGALLAIGAAAPPDPFVGHAAVGTVQCVDRIGGQALTILNDRTLLYRPVGKRVWRIDLAERCVGLDPDDILVVDQFAGSQICTSDRVRSIERGANIPGPWCRIGTITAFEKARR